MACKLLNPSHGGGRNVIALRGVLLELISHADQKMLHKGDDWKTLSPPEKTMLSAPEQGIN